jgi:hypothetical protein
MFEPLPEADLLARPVLRGDEGHLPGLTQPGSGSIAPAESRQESAFPIFAPQVRAAAPKDDEQPAPAKPYQGAPLPTPAAQARFTTPVDGEPIGPARVEPFSRLAGMQAIAAEPASSPIVATPIRPTEPPASHPEAAEAYVAPRAETQPASAKEISPPVHASPPVTPEEHIPLTGKPLGEHIPVGVVLAPAREPAPLQAETATLALQTTNPASGGSSSATVQVQPGQPPLPASSKTSSERPASREPPQAGRVAAEPAPVIQVTIGRIEVRAATPPAPPAARSQPAKPAISLDEYLRRRSGERQ